MNEMQTGTPRTQPPKRAELSLPPPAWIINQTDNGYLYVIAERQMELTDITFGAENWRCEIVEAARIEKDQTFTDDKGRAWRLILATAGCRVIATTENGQIVRENIGADTARQKMEKNEGVDILDQALKFAWASARKRAIADLGRRFGAGISKMTLVEARAHAANACVAAMKQADESLPGMLKHLREHPDDNACAARMRDLIADAHRIDPHSGAEWRRRWSAGIDKTAV